MNFGFFVVALYDAMFFAPFNIVLAKKFEQTDGSNPLSLWQVAKSLKYADTVCGLSFAVFWDHATYLFTLSDDKGHEKVVPESTANLLKLLIAADILFQVLAEKAAATKQASAHAGRDVRRDIAAAELVEYFPWVIFFRPGIFPGKVSQFYL
jgi:hypothetical protein